MTEPTPRPDVPDEVMRAFVNGAIESPAEVKANSPEWVRNGLARALAAYEASGVAETEAQRRRADEAEQALREEVTAMAEERIATGRANILNLIRERDEQTQRAEKAERERDEALEALAYGAETLRRASAERKGRLAAEAAVRRALAVLDQRIGLILGEVGPELRTALTIEQPKETRG